MAGFEFHRLSRRMFSGVCLLWLTSIASYGQQPTAAPSAKEKKIKVLIIDGVSNHDWKQTTALIRGILEPTGLFEIDVSTSPPQANSPGWDTWRPEFKKYEAVIQTYNDIGGKPHWPEAVEKDFVSYVKDGGGVFVYHAGNNAFPHWKEYDEIIGLGWRKTNQGVALSLTKEGEIERHEIGEGQNTSHGPRTDVVLMRLGEHAIHAGMPQRWKTPLVEVYYFARGPAKNLQVLSYGLEGRTQKYWPLEWTVTYGEGRVYNSTFGHVWAGDVQPVAVRCAGMQTLLIRALEWVAKRPVDYPLPADFPTEENISVRGEIALPK